MVPPDCRQEVKVKKKYITLGDVGRVRGEAALHNKYESDRKMVDRNMQRT
jgi:hypothetical protein